MKQSILSLQADHRGRINNSQSVTIGSEIQNSPLEGSPCTTEEQASAKYGGEGRPSASRHVVGTVDKQDAAFPIRQGPIVLPFIQNLLGEGTGAFCGDTRIISAIAANASAANDMFAHEVCSFVGWDGTIDIPKVDEIDTDSAIHGVVRGIVEDGDRRTYMAGSYVSGNLNIYIIQFSGLAKVQVFDIEDDDTLAFGDPLFVVDEAYYALTPDQKAWWLEHVDEDAVFRRLGIFMGYSLSDYPAARGTTDVLHVLLGGASSGVTEESIRDLMVSLVDDQVNAAMPAYLRIYRDDNGDFQLECEDLADFADTIADKGIAQWHVDPATKEIRLRGIPFPTPTYPYMVLTIPPVSPADPQWDWVRAQVPVTTTTTT